MRKHIWQMIQVLFMGRKEFLEIKHNHQLTQFLKNNPAFRRLAWRIYHIKTKMIKDLDEKLIQKE